MRSAPPHQETVNHPLFARMYLKMVSRRLDEGERGYRRSLLEGLSGHVIELGAGSGINFRFYPKAVAHVLAVEPEPVLRHAAIDNASRAPVPVNVVSGVSAALPAEDSTLDAGWRPLCCARCLIRPARWRSSTE